MPKPPSPNQISYLAFLIEKRAVPASVLASYEASKLGIASLGEISKAIEAAKVSPWKNALEESKPAAQGYYLHNGVPCVVVRSKETGKAYAKTLGTKGWEYAAGLVYKLKPEEAMSLEQAKEYGKLHGRCAICGKTLTEPSSVEMGIGPVCIKKVA